MRTIFGRTFLLTVFALMVAQGIGLALLITRPELPDGPAHRSDHFPRLDASEEPASGPPPSPGGPFGDRPPGPPHPPPVTELGGLIKKSLFLFALGLAALLPFAWMFATALSAPIRRFSAAATRMGNDPKAPPLAREGPEEMRLAVDSFNAMQARLNRILQERTQMVGAIAHDLRAPLTRLAFRLDDLPAPLREKANADIQEMKLMISSALDFLRDQSQSGPHEPLDLRLLVESAVDDRSDLGHDVDLQPGAPVTVRGNPVALKRAIGNLIDNAVKYGERARLRILAGGNDVVLEVDDDGPGIPQSFLCQVFEPFFRLESSRNRDTGGIGLGLAVVKSILLDHGGEITLHNRKDGGLRAILRLKTGA